MREGRSLEILRRWKKAVREMLLMWDVYERVLSKITPRLLTAVEVETRQPSMRILGGCDLESDDLDPMRRISLLLPLSFNLLFDIQFVMVCRQSIRAVGGDIVSGLVVM